MSSDKFKSVPVSEILEQIAKFSEDKRFEPLVKFWTEKIGNTPSQDGSTAIWLTRNDVADFEKLAIAIFDQMMDSIDERSDILNASLNESIERRDQRLRLLRATDSKNRIHLHTPDTKYSF